MADNRLVHNTAVYPLVVSDDGARVLGNSAQEIDISQPRAQEHLADGNLVLVNTPQEESKPRGSAKQKASSENTTTNGE